MQSSGQGRDGAMAAIIGPRRPRLPELVEGPARTASSVSRTATRRARVVSGERPAIEAAADIGRELGARKVIVLPVSVAAHSPLMAEAAEGMRAVLESVDFSDPLVPPSRTPTPARSRRPARLGTSSSST